MSALVASRRPAAHGRLTAGADISATLRDGARAGGTLLGVHVRPSNRDGPARLTVIAGRRIGGAVQRNRAKRLLRAAARTVAFLPGQDVVLVARSACVASSSVAVADELVALGARLHAIESA